MRVLPERSWLHSEPFPEVRVAREWYLARHADAGQAFMGELAPNRIDTDPRRNGAGRP